MGMTGSGKTTFISHLVSPESEDKPGVGHSLKSSELHLLSFENLSFPHGYTLDQELRSLEWR